MDQITQILTGGGIGAADIAGILSVLAAFLPPTYRPIAGLIVKLINIGAFNFLWATNKAEPGKPRPTKKGSGRPGA